MSDSKISALPAVAAAADGDLLPIVQGSGPSAATRRATIAQLRTGLLADRPVHVREFGATGDGVADDAPAIQAAIDAMAASGGGVLLFGPRRYRLASAVVVNGVSITFQGAGFTEGPNAADGTWFLIDTTGFTPFTFTGIGARGCTVRDIAVRQAHNAAQAPGWAPTNYDYVFRVQDCLGAVDFENLFLCGVNRGIWIDNSGRFNIQRLRGQVFTTGIEIDRALDIGRISHAHFWTFVTANDNVVRWQQLNQDTLVFRRVDGVFLDDIFVLGARSSLRFAASASGVTTKFYIGNLYADFVRHGVWIDGNGIEGQIANATTQSELWNAAGAPLAGSNGIRVDGNNARLQIGNLRIDDCEDNAIRVNGIGNRLDLFSFRAEYFNRLNNGASAIHVANVASGTPNKVFLGSPALLGNGNGGPVANVATNGLVALAGPAGRLDRPGRDGRCREQRPVRTRHHRDRRRRRRGRGAAARTPRAMSRWAARRAHRASASPRPPLAANYVLASGAIANDTPSLSAQGSDANVNLTLASKGSGNIVMLRQGFTAFEVAAVGVPRNYLRISGAVAGSTPTLQALGQDTNVSIMLAPKGSGAVETAAPLRLPTYTVSTLPSASGFARSLIYVSNGAANKRLAISDGTAWRWPDGAVVT